MRLIFSERYVVALNFLLIAGCAYFAARSVNDIIARRLIVIPPAPAVVASSRAPRDLPRTSYDFVVERDIFNSVKQQAAPPPQPPPPAAGADLHIKLVGTSHLSWTKPFAAFEDQSTHDQAIYRQGDQIPDAGELISVAKTKAVINHNGTNVTLEMQDDLADGGSPAPDAMPLPAPIVPVMPPMGRDVQRVGPNQFVVSRSSVNRNLQNMGQLFTQMRAIPNMDNGKTDGFRLSEVVPGSLFSQMGLRNGDVVNSIGGQDLNDPTQAIGLLNSLRQASSLSITVMRHGRPVELNYQIE
ncbi:MAG TPA: type II secretion system protein GspC [Candidatus Binataceae bacterium]|jgi:general secretion pathway protein C|nr:type II secretion system protein GspC [Candidatus Binataceae bacterium]